MHALPEERQGHEGSLRQAVLARARAALGAIEAARRRIDDLNVYPVPDGDTGTNLTLSVRAIVKALERTDATERASLAQEVTRAALLGARGNSGVILSQIVRGAAESLAESDDLARALRRASDTAYEQVGNPVPEGGRGVHVDLPGDRENRVPRLITGVQREVQGAPLRKLAT